MHTEENTEINSATNYTILNTIKQIDSQLSYLKSLYNFDEMDNLFVQRKEQEKNELKKLAEKNEIEQQIQEVVQKINTTSNETKFNEIQELTSNVKDNNTLLISEKEGRVYLPYKIGELKAYLKEYAEDYCSLSDVVNKEYIVPLEKYKNPRISRFREMYSLMRDIEMKSIIESFNKAVKIMFNAKLNPAIISACKSENQINEYLYLLERNRENEFKEFLITYDYVPNKVYFQDSFTNYDDYMHMPRKQKRGRHY